MKKKFFFFFGFSSPFKNKTHIVLLKVQERKRNHRGVSTRANLVQELVREELRSQTADNDIGNSKKLSSCAGHRKRCDASDQRQRSPGGGQNPGAS